MKGLQEWPKVDHPPVAVVHIVFQIMVGCGMALAEVSIVALILARRKHRRFGDWALPDHTRFLRTLVLVAPLGFIVIEAGWTVTEVGWQSFIIQGVMRTSQAVTPVPYLTIPLFTFTLVYLFLAFRVPVAAAVQPESAHRARPHERQRHGKERRRRRISGGGAR